MSITMDFCTTSVLRPEILRKCYKSFKENLIGINLKDCHLFINIDPVPAGECTPEENIKIASEFFGLVTPRITETPCLGWAVKWLWSQVQSEFVFLLEDDWLLLKPVDINKMLEYFNKKPTLQQIRLTYASQKYIIGKHHTVNYGLSPGISRKGFCKYWALLMDGIIEGRKFNPERFIRKNKRYPTQTKEMKLLQYKLTSLKKREREVLYYPPYKEYPLNVVKDLSKNWKLTHKTSGRVDNRGMWR